MNGGVTFEASSQSGFQVRLTNFEGPFDLLLQLIFAHRLDVTEGALHQVTDEFIAYTRAIGPELELEETTAFLVVAATLLDLKAARLLPSGQVDDDEDLALLTDTVDKVRDRLNPKLEISGILLTRYDPRTVNAREVMARVVERFGDLVFDTVVTRTVRFPETSVAGEPITTWAPKSTGAIAYRALAREVIDRFGA